MHEAFEVSITDFSLLERLNALSDELELTWDDLIEIAIERFLNDFNDDVALFTCRKSIIKERYQKPEPGEIF